MVEVAGFEPAAFFVPKPSYAEGCQCSSVPDLGTTVHQRVLASIDGDGDRHSFGYSVAVHAREGDRSQGYASTPRSRCLTVLG